MTSTMDYVDNLPDVSPKQMLEAEREAVNDGLTDTMGVMIYELGSVSQNLMFAKNAPSDDSGAGGNYANALTELGDLLAQAALLHEKILEIHPDMALRPSWEQLVKMGRHRQIERMTALANKMRRPASLSEDVPV